MGGGTSRPPSRAPPTNPSTPIPVTPRNPSVQNLQASNPNIPAAASTPTPPPVPVDDGQGQPAPTEDSEDSTQKPVDQQDSAGSAKREDLFLEFPTPEFLRKCNELALRQIEEEKQPRRGDDGLLRRIPPRLTGDQLLKEDDKRRLDDLASDVSDDVLQRPIADLAERLKRDTKSEVEFVRVAYRWVLFQLISRAKASGTGNAVTQADATNNVDADSTEKEMTALDYIRQIKAAKKNLNELLHHILMAGGLEVTLISGVVKSDSRLLSTTMSTTASVTISKTGQIVKAVEPAGETPPVSLSYRKWLAVVIDDNWLLVDALPVAEYYLEEEPHADEVPPQPASTSSPTNQHQDTASPGSSVEKVITSTTVTSGVRTNFDGYFLSEPEIMVYSHFPAAESDWQLLYRPATIDEFIQMADLTPAFFRYRLELRNQLFRSFEHNEKVPCELVFGQPVDAHYRFNYRLTRSNSGGASTSTSTTSSSLDRFVFVENLSSSGQVKCTLRFPSVGKYLFELFCCESTDDVTDGGVYLLVCRYQIDATRPAAEVRPLPENSFREWGPGWKLTLAGLDATTFMSGDHSMSGTIDIDRYSQTPGEVDISFKINKGNDDSKYLVQITSDVKSKNDLSRYSVLFVYSDDDNNERYLTVKAKFVETGWYAMTLLAKVDDDVAIPAVAHKRKSVSGFERICCYLVRVSRAATDLRPYPKVSSGRLGRTEQGARLGIYPVSARHRTSFLKVDTEGKEEEIEFASTEPCHFSAELHLQIDENDSDKKFEDMTFVEERANGATIRVRFPEKGLYTIRICGRPRNSSGEDVPVFTYIVDVNQPTAKFGPFPHKSESWTEGCQLVQPKGLAGLLPAQSLIPFAVVIPKAVEVKLTKPADDLKVSLKRWRGIDENDNERLQQNITDDDHRKDLWTGDFNTGDEGKLILHAAFDATLEFKELLTFQVIDVGRSTVTKKSIREKVQQQPSQLPVKNTQPPPVNRPVQEVQDFRGTNEHPEPTRSRSPPPPRRSRTLNQSSSATEKVEWTEKYRIQFDEELRIHDEQRSRDEQRRRELERTRLRLIELQRSEEERKRREVRSVDQRPQNVYGELADQRVARIREDLRRSTLQRDSIGLTEAVGDAERYHLEDVIGDDYYRARDVKKSLNRVDKLKTALICLDRATLNEIRAYNNPPDPLHRVVSATLLVLGIPEQLTMTWQNCQRYFSTVGPDNLLRRVHLFDVGLLHPEIAARAEQILRDCRRKEVRDACFGAAILYDWTAGVCDECLTMNGSKEVKPATGERQKQLLSKMSSALRMK